MERSEYKSLAELTLDIEDVKGLIRLRTFVRSLRSLQKSKSH